MLFKYNHLPDNEHLLVKGCIASERSSQSKLYNLYAAKMLAVCMRYAKSREEGEDILQEGFMRVFTYIKQFKGEGSLEGWIRKIMVNCALSRYKSKIHLKPAIELNIEQCNTPDDADIITNINAKELLKLVQSLTPAYRIVFNLYVFEGMKHREIAEMLGISEGTSKSNLSDARGVLQKALQSKNKVEVYRRKSL